MGQILRIVLYGAESETAFIDARSISLGPSMGIYGDRRYPDGIVTLVSTEMIDIIYRRLHLPMTLPDTGNQILVTRTDLESFVGRAFRAGSVGLYGISAQHCGKERPHPRILIGIRARVVSEGVIHVGDSISAAA